MMRANTIYLSVGVGLILLLSSFFSTYKLAESPRVWMDEGILIQASRNLAEQGVFETQVAPHQFVSAGYISTSCTILCPIALAFKLFGTSLLVARSVMVIYIFGLIALVALLLFRFINPKHVLLPLLVVTTFAPFYGHGRNVLGEIPGLFYLAGAAYCLYSLEYGSAHKKIYLLGFGLLAGLAFVTKPIFLLLAPALVVAAVISYKRKLASIQEIILVAVTLLLPVIMWVVTQFSGDDILTIFKIYANPHNVDTVAVIKQNLIRFFTESQPLYMIIAFALWTLSIIFRLWRKYKIAVAEYWLYIFSGLVIVAYTRTIGYYRYFFLAQFWSLVYLVASLETFSSNRWYRLLLEIVLLILVCFQVYSFMNHSWVANYWNSSLTADLESYVPALTTNHSVFIYQAPELVTFLPHNNYWQYLEVTSTIKLGQDGLKVLALGQPDVLMVGSTESIPAEDLVHYKKINQIDHYSFFINKLNK